MNNRILITALLVIFLGIVFLPKLFNKPVVENIYVNATENNVVNENIK